MVIRNFGGTYVKGTDYIVEDEVEIAELIRDYLEDEGFRVSHSIDGQQGLEKFHAEKPDLVVLDLMLPKMDGFEVCRLMRKDSEIPVIILSSKTRIWTRFLL